MAGRGVWRCYSLLLFLAKCISGFGIEQSFTIYMDVGNDIENVIKWGTTCEAKQTNMESILQRNIWELKESERKLNEKISNSNSKIANLEKRVDSFEQKLILMENTLQSTIWECKKKEEELKNSISKLSSAVNALNSKSESRGHERPPLERPSTVPGNHPSVNLPTLPTSPSGPKTNVPDVGRLAEQACENTKRNKPPILAIENFYYMASIGIKRIYSYRHRCMGALIEKRFVIATSQCLSKVDVNAVRLGYARNVEGNVKKVHLHPKFSRYSRDNSYVGLVELENELLYSANLYPICLCTSPTIPLKDAYIYYAYYDETSKLSAGQIRSRIVAYKNCLTLGESHLSNLICTENDNGTTIDMYTASNGPIVLLANGINDKDRLIAVDSKSENRDASYFSHQIISVYDNLDFIENIVWKGE
ncbi:uncharacterized protein LOC101459028 isoform X1 [Ceratitis capitata]|uniref:uncharacterized protein LOC101459028 isoform X1 n=1 Tax=Ceratitis capitata TaxID=7213 RepID=UPI0006188CE5|nr:uncharacterized protein LOC101459028 isoform X1 [Ceratitis capitata]